MAKFGLLAIIGLVAATAQIETAAAQGLPILTGRWTQAASCNDPSANDGADARTFSSLQTSTSNDQCRVASHREGGSRYPSHLVCTDNDDHPEVFDILITVVSPRELQWKDLHTPFTTTYRYCAPH